MLCLFIAGLLDVVFALRLGVSVCCFGCLVCGLRWLMFVVDCGLIVLGCGL